MIRQMQISEARRRLNGLHKDLGPQETLSITSRGKQVLAVMPWELYEAVTETLEIFEDRALIAQLRRGVKDIQEGRTIDWDEVKKELKIEV